MSTMVKFLTDLATDPIKQAAFMSSPEEIMAAAGLSASERAVLATRSSARIAESLAGQGFQAAYLMREPNPDPSPDPDPDPDPDPEDTSAP